MPEPKGPIDDFTRVKVGSVAMTDVRSGSENVAINPRCDLKDAPQCASFPKCECGQMQKFGN